jgi:hypothetical protein
VAEPKRIQRKRTNGWRMPEGAVYVGRGSKWGNPFVVGETQIRMPALDGSNWEYEGRLHKTSGQMEAFHTSELIPSEDGRLQYRVIWQRIENATREQVIELYRQRVLRRDPEVGRGPRLSEIRDALAGHDLACWCPIDQPCHADVLLELANGAPTPTEETP